MQSTALILRDPRAPEVHVLECDGPSVHCPTVHRYPGDFATGNYMSFEEFAALPDHSKFPGPSEAEMDHANARRVYRLMEFIENGGNITYRQLREIRGRLKLLAPFCDEDF